VPAPAPAPPSPPLAPSAPVELEVVVEAPPADAAASPSSLPGEGGSDSLHATVSAMQTSAVRRAGSVMRPWLPAAAG